MPRHYSALSLALFGVPAMVLGYGSAFVSNDFLVGMTQGPPYKGNIKAIYDIAFVMYGALGWIACERAYRDDHVFAKMLIVPRALAALIISRATHIPYWRFTLFQEIAGQLLTIAALYSESEHNGKKK